MHGEPDRLDAGQRGGEPIGGRRLAEVDAEFVLLSAGRDLGVGPRIDIGIDAERDRRGPAACRWRRR